MTAPIRLAFLEDDQTARSCPLCRHGYRHPLCSLYASYEASALELRADRSLAGGRRVAVMAAFVLGKDDPR